MTTALTWPEDMPVEDREADARPCPTVYR